MLRALMRIPRIRDLVFAPDIGPLVARGNEVWFENTTLLQQPGEPDSRMVPLMTFHSVRGNHGTKLDGFELARDTARFLNRQRRLMRNGVRTKK